MSIVTLKNTIVALAMVAIMATMAVSADAGSHQYCGKTGTYCGVHGVMDFCNGPGRCLHG